MSRSWQLQDAKNRFSEVVEEALHDGPQVITRHGVETAVVMSFAEYRKMLLNRSSLSAFFAESPLVRVDISPRDMSPARENSNL